MSTKKQDDDVMVTMTVQLFRDGGVRVVNEWATEVNERTVVLLQRGMLSTVQAVLDKKTERTAP